uniref:Eukaryotic translation initiation factor 4E type 2-like n=1 Tax=Acanthochromis polyacanthus TaxID=80966 RepID=A0A3Q1GSL1_9TELE
MVRPGDLSGHSDFHLFKEGIKPMWEDESNRSGGKWIIRLRKGLASRFWENIILAMLGEQFMVGEEICGAVVSIRFQVLLPLLLPTGLLLVPEPLSSSGAAEPSSDLFTNISSSPPPLSNISGPDLHWFKFCLSGEPSEYLGG